MIDISVYEPDVLDGHGDVVTEGALLGVMQGCTVYPRGASTEVEFRSHTVVDGITILAPTLLAGIGPQHEISYYGERYKVTGDIGIWDYLDGSNAGNQINATRVKG